MSQKRLSQKQQTQEACRKLDYCVPVHSKCKIKTFHNPLELISCNERPLYKFYIQIPVGSTLISARDKDKEKAKAEWRFSM